MDVVVVGVAPGRVAERARLGQDVRDELWDGAHHVVPSPGREHQRIAGELFIALHPVAAAAGLALAYELNLFGPLPSTEHDYRVPDLMVFDPAIATERGVHGPADLVVEVGSPGDESLAKLPFFDRVGVREVVIVDGGTKAVRRWLRSGPGLAEAAASAGAAHRLAAIPVELGEDAGALVAVTAAGRVRI